MSQRLLNTPESSDQMSKVDDLKASLAKKTLNEDVKNNYFLYFYLFATIGLVNNAGYVMVGTASHDLAIKFDKKQYMPLFTFCEIIFGSLIKFVNSKYLINVRHSLRLTINSIIMIIAYLLIAAITIKPIAASFYLGLFCALLHGCASSLGESTLLGLLKGFPSRLVGAFSSGTGLAGVFGAGIFIVLKPFMSNGFIFLIATPIVILYFINAMIAIKRKNTYPFVEENPIAQERAASVRKSIEIGEDVLDDPTDELDGIEVGEDAGDNVPMSISNARMIFGKMGWFMSNLAIVYFLEYSITIGFADAISNRLTDHATKTEGWNEDSFFIKEAYVIFSFCYQFGVLLSRSSLDIIKIKRIEIITTLQLINFIFFFLNAHFFFLKNYYVMFVWMIFVGLMGGAAYVNVMYLIINSDKVKKTEKELAVITTCIFDDFGILSATILSLILSNTLFKD